MLSKYGAGEDSWEYLGLQGDETSQSSRNSTLNIHWKDWCWSWNCNTLPTWCKELTHLKRPWCWEGLRAGREVGGRGWDGRMSSPTRWTWVWVNFGSWWWTGRPGVLQFMWSQSQTRLSDWTDLLIDWLTDTYIYTDTLYIYDLPGGSDSKESACNGGDSVSIPELGWSPGEGNGYSSIIAWRIPWIEKPGRPTVCGVTKSQTWLSD